MLKLLFGRSSHLVQLLELGGLFGMALMLVRWFQEPLWNATVVLFLTFTLLYLFIRLCYLIHWYPGEGRDIGIEVHLKKSLVPTSYILPVVILSFVIGGEVFFLILGTLMLAIIAFVNILMIGFHFKDDASLPINSLSLKRYDEIPHPKEYAR